MRPFRIDLAGFARDGTLGDHKGLMHLVERADALGFGGIWFNEFHFNREELPYPSTLLLGAEILARTKTLRFGTSILVLPLHDPLILAEQIAQLDFQSGGRIDIGIGRGTQAETFAALGIPFEDARARYEQALDILLSAWRGESLCCDGPFWRFRDVRIGPPPVQSPHPPVYAAATSEESVGHAVAHGLPLLLSLEPNEARQLPLLARAGASADLLARSSLSRYVICTPTSEDAERRLETLLSRLNARRAARAVARGQTVPPARNKSEMMEGFAIAGTPDQCRRQLLALSQRTGSRSLRCLFSANGLIATADALDGMELFAREVLPALDAPTPHSIPKGVIHENP